MAVPSSTYFRRLTIGLLFLAFFTAGVGIYRDNLDYTQVFLSIVALVGVINGLGDRDKKKKEEDDQA